MNKYKYSIEVLELENVKNINLNIIKKQYHKMALKYHPDKNKSNDSSMIFPIIQEAYEYLTNIYKLNKNLENNQNSQNNQNNDNNDKNNQNEYVNMLNDFITIMLDNINLSLIKEIVNIVINSYTNISLQVFEKIDKKTIISIYTFLFEYKNLLFLNEDILNKILIIIQNNYCNILYILNPTLEDLLNDNIYKLDIDSVIYYVPLWCKEVIFEKEELQYTNYFYNKQKDLIIIETNEKETNEKETNEKETNEIIVNCIPILNNNITIDDENNLFITINIDFTKDLILNNNQDNFIDVNITDNLVFKIPINSLFIKKKQNIVFKNKGILKNNTDFFDIREKNRSDIIVTILFT